MNIIPINTLGTVIKKNCFLVLLSINCFLFFIYFKCKIFTKLVIIDIGNRIYRSSINSKFRNNNTGVPITKIPTPAIV